ncbi:MAG: hydantoinase/oxoprolinase family protein [Alphaproteobacteria bacterium]|nr:hydantoinase/oxoprolinase family protein [Alphaproteobacteria bacterium]
MGNLSLGIDIGGTFTDIVIYDPAAAKHAIWKEPTTPDDPTRGVIAGTRRLIETTGIAPDDIARVVHATTLFTNALIERKGAKTALITTDGFRDVLEIGRERKFELYDLFIEMPEPLVPRRWRRQVPERLSESGTVEIPLDGESLSRELADLTKAGIESVAVVFLHSYANPAHERAALEIIERDHPGLSVSLSCDVAPEIREYERSSTTVANAYVRPLAERYLDGLAQQIRHLGIPGPFFLMLSNGGLTHVEEAKRTPVRLLESGPAAGALAGAYFGAHSETSEVLAFDMGGTTAKLSLIDGGEPSIAYSFEAARTKRFNEGSGLPIKISTIELIEIGAGGGSIAHMDELDLLKVGPQSSGAVPGPVCYAKGGEAPTVTDADLLLGYLNADFFLGGEMQIDRAAAERAMQPLMEATGLSLTEVAWGIHDVVNENMASAARVQITQRGKDPRDYAMLATGGAGPVHAYHVAEKLNLRRLICPSAAGVGSTVGLLMAPARIDRAISMVSRLDDLDWPAFETAYQALEKDAAAVLRETGADLDRLDIRRMADMRYLGQGSEIVVDLPAGPYSASSKDAIVDRFEEQYRRLFTRTRPGVAIQMVNLRASLSAPVADSRMQLAASDAGDAEPSKGTRPVYFAAAGGFVDTPVLDRYRIKPGSKFEGPAVFEENESTLIIGPGAVCVAEASGNLMITLPEPRS